MTRDDWKISNRARRVAARKLMARAHRITRKRISSLLPQHYAAQMELLAQIHKEVAPELEKLARFHEALESLGLA